ncbi:uncharacterized protein LOC143881539 isoform X2 [Tasmannia lanceolata]|uniref:uncharacterized protein LOC143881539 isoform X2 n=1 Tax=Tasmannia lanceolata TaxID=3420 RepID=UPI0040645BE3
MDLRWKGCCIFSYVRPHGAASPSNVKTCGSGGLVSFPSSMSSRGDWDFNEASQQMMSCSGVVSSSCNTGTPSVSQNGFDFSLPRKRTILDVGIETFERKSWRHPGVDITDFFNFGLDEESWKHYCNRLEHFRQQATMQTKIPVYESLRPNQASCAKVYKAGFLHGTVASQALCCEISPTGQPKGRAIQVERGISERQPSIDMRRPRHRDSDVVIQIAVHSPVEDSSVSSKEELEHIDESLLKTSDNGVSDVEDDRNALHFDNAHGDGLSYPELQFDVLSIKKAGVCRPTRYAQQKAACRAESPDHDHERDEQTNPDGHHHQIGKEPVPEETAKMLQTIEDAMDKDNLSRDKSSMLEADSAYGDHIQHNLSPSYLESHSESAKGEINVDPSSVSGLREAILPECLKSNGSKSDTSKTKLQNSEGSSQEQCHIQEELNSCSRKRVHGVSELKIPMDNGKASLMANRKGWYDGDRLSIRREPRKDRLLNYNFDGGEDSSYYRERERLIGYHGRRFSDKQDRSACTEHFHRKGSSQFREEMEPYLRRNWDERDYFLEQRVAARNNEMNYKEYYFHESGWGDHEMSAITHKGSSLAISENSSYYYEREKYLRPRRKGENDQWLRKEVDDDDFEVEHRYMKEFSQEKYRRHIGYPRRENASIQDKHGRHLTYTDRDIEKLDQRERDDCREIESLDMSCRSVENDDKYWGYPGSLSTQRYREFHILDRRRYCDASPPKNHATNSWRSNERYADHWRLPNRRDMYSNKRRDGGFFVSSSKEHHHLSHKDLDFEEMAFYSNDLVCDDKRKPSWQSNATDWPDDERCFRDRERDNFCDMEASILYGRSSRHGQGCVNGSRLDKGIRKLLVPENKDSKVSKRISSISDAIDGGRHEGAAMRCRESVDLYLNDWGGKYPGRSSKAGDITHDRHGDTHQLFDRDLSVQNYSDEVYKRREAPLPPPKVETNRLHSISSKVERVGQCNSEQSPGHGDEKWLDKYPVTQHQEVSQLEEGQLAVEPENIELCTMGQKRASEKTAPSSAVEISHSDNNKEKNLHSEDATDDSKVVAGYDNHRILETIAKMERRRERFKEPIALKKEPDKNPKPQSNPVVETVEVKQQRPARKRRWGGS